MNVSLWHQLAEETILLGPAVGLSREEALPLAQLGKLSQWRSDCRIRTRSGETRWISDAAIEIFDEQGKPTGSLGILQDITERKQAEETLQRVAEQRKRLLEVSQLLLAALSPDEVTKETQQALQGILPYDFLAIFRLDEAMHLLRPTMLIKQGQIFDQPTEWSVPVGQGIVGSIVQSGQGELINNAHLDPRAMYPTWLSRECEHLICLPLQRQGRIVGVFLLNRLADPPFTVEEYELVQLFVSFVSLALENAQLYTTLEQRVIERTAQLQAVNKELENEIAERQQVENALAEERNLLRTLIDNLPDFIYVKDTESRFVLVNVTCLKDREMASFEEIIGKTDFDLHPPELAAHYYADDQAVIQSGQPLIGREELNLTHYGQQRWLSTTKAPLRDSRGQSIGLVGMSRDITKYKQGEEAIRQLNTDLNRRTIELEAVNKELEAFSYSVSHDLRAPLRAIDGFSQALLEDYLEQLDETGRDHLQRVRAATQRMGQLIDDMLNLSRITRSELRRQPVNLSALVATIAWELRQTQLERQVEFIIAPGVTVEGDPHLLHIALENLINNAWKFTQKQFQAIIEFGVSQDNNQLTYFVRDNGVGFDMAYVNKLFAPFQRLHARHEFEGTGVGLATVQRIIQRHGGQLWVEATVGQGATFYFTLL
jgi:PAS domain S-box-containing protein